jgi:hypothetical protein
MIGNLSLDLLTLVIIGVFAFVIERKGWVARWTVIVNGVLLSGSIFPNLAGSILPARILPPITTFPELLQWWMWGSLIAAVAFALDYFNKLNIPKTIKQWIYRVYSSKTVFGILLAAIFNIFDFWWLFVIGVWIFACYKLKHEF